MSYIEEKHGQYLVAAARRAILSYLENGEKIKPPDDTPHILTGKCGVFVTLGKVEQDCKTLRGCIGYPEPTLPLIDATIDSAINAAVGDPRFPPVERDEMSHILIDINVLSPPEEILARSRLDIADKIYIGRDGLIIQKGWRRGLLLPQVPVEMGWDSEEFLSQCCLKAGLTPDSWLVRDTKILRFESVAYGETEAGGRVIRRSVTETHRQ